MQYLDWGKTSVATSTANADIEIESSDLIPVAQFVAHIFKTGGWHP